MKLHETIKSGSFVTTAAVPSQINLKVIFVHCALLMHGTWRSTSVISPCMIPNMLTTSISLKRLTWTLSLQNSLGGGLTNSPQSPIICAALIFAAFLRHLCIWRNKFVKGRHTGDIVKYCFSFKRSKQMKRMLTRRRQVLMKLKSNPTRSRRIQNLVWLESNCSTLVLHLYASPGAWYLQYHKWVCGNTLTTHYNSCIPTKLGVIHINETYRAIYIPQNIDPLYVCVTVCSSEPNSQKWKIWTRMIPSKTFLEHSKSENFYQKPIKNNCASWFFIFG